MVSGDISSTPIKVGLAQINNRFSGQVYLPLSAGLLQSYAQKNLEELENYEFLPFIYSRTSVDDAVSQLIQADIVGFSSYVWNFQLSIKIAESLKQRKPKIIIVFGGPHVPDNSEEYLRDYPFIDIACHGEGEKIFLEILKHVPIGQWSKIPSISYINEDNMFVETSKISRMKDLSEIPSPYLDGTFDQLILDNPEENWIAMWETNRGCPFSCTFCDWGSAIAAKVNKWNIERLFKEIDWFAKQKVEYLFCADANFGILPRDVEIAKYCAQIKKKYGYPHAISIQSTKNVQERSYLVQKILAEAGLNKAVVMSMQSVNPETLKAVKRENISLKVFEENQRRFAEDGIETMTDIILGMPEETYDSFTKGIATLIENGQHNRIQFGNLSILPNAEMGDPEYQKKYGMKLVTTDIVNIHGRIDDPENEVIEKQILVIATNSMPQRDWTRSRVFAWMTGLLHFNKILQIPLIVMHEIAKISYTDLLELFSERRFNELENNDNVSIFPILAELQEFMIAKAKDIQNGGLEFCHSPEWLDIYWPVEEYIFVKLCVENKLHLFYKEAEAAFRLLLEERSIDLDPKILNDAIRLNKEHIKLPFKTSDTEVELSYNIWEFYRSVVIGKLIELENKPRVYHVNRTAETWDSWDEWFQKVVWYGNRKGAYLYGNTSQDKQLTGHY